MSTLAQTLAHLAQLASRKGTLISAVYHDDGCPALTTGSTLMCNCRPLIILRDVHGNEIRRVQCDRQSPVVVEGGRNG